MLCALQMWTSVRTIRVVTAGPVSIHSHSLHVAVLEDSQEPHANDVCISDLRFIF